MYLEIKLDSNNSPSFYTKVIKETKNYYYINENIHLNIMAKFELKTPKLPNVVRIHKENKLIRGNIILLGVIKDPPTGADVFVFD
jgi:hypothetical protein